MKMNFCGHFLVLFLMCTVYNARVAYSQEAAFAPQASEKTALVPAMFIFGDSLIDNGNNNNLASLAKANYFPYGIDFNGGPTGRFSNGFTMVDTIGIGLKTCAFILVLFSLMICSHEHSFFMFAILALFTSQQVAIILTSVARCVLFLNSSIYVCCFISIIRMNYDSTWHVIECLTSEYNFTST